MEKYRIAIKKRMVLSTVIVLLSASFVILNQIEVLNSISFFNQNKEVTNFQLGLLLGFGLLAILSLYKNGAAIKDEKKLKILYNKECDERQCLIRQKAGMPMMMVTSGIMIFAGIIAGYFNTIVFFTLILSAMIQLTLGAIVKIYYMKKI